MAVITHGNARDSLSNPKPLSTNCFVYNIYPLSPTNIRSIQSQVRDRYTNTNHKYKISDLLLLTSAPLCYSVSLPTGQPQPSKFYYICYYLFWSQRKTALAICVHQIFLNMRGKNCIEEVSENKSCITALVEIICGAHVFLGNHEFLIEIVPGFIYT